MSSSSISEAVSASDMVMIQAALSDAGYDAYLLRSDHRQYNKAAFFVMNMFIAGETSQKALTTQLRRNFGKATPGNPIPHTSFSKYAIQGLPVNMRHFLGLLTKLRFRPIEAEENSWENEGGAMAYARVVSRPRVSSFSPAK